MTGGRANIGGRARRWSGLLDALQEAGLAAEPPRPRTWHALLDSIVCDEVTPTFAEPIVLDWLCDLDEPSEAP